jgi:hypothetical protein
MARIFEPTKIDNKISPILKHTTIEQAIHMNNAGIAIEVNDGSYVKFVKTEKEKS